MDDLIIKAYDAQRDFTNKPFRSACYAPYVSLFFDTAGNVLACCKNWTYVLGNVAHQRLDEIWKGGKINALRKALADYRFEAGCEFCEWQIKGGDYRGAFPSVFEEFPVQSMEPEWPSMLQFGGSNTCNLECVMCNGVLSSSIRARREGLPPLPKVYSDQFFEDLRKFLPHLRIAHFFGEEPFLAQECFRIWDMIIEDGLHTRCHVSTNGTHYNARVERALEALPFSITVSVDGATKETVEKIRVNARHEEVMENIKRFRAYTRSRGTYLVLSYCLMRQNWHEFGEFLLLAESFGCEVFVNTVIDPDQCSLYTLPPEELAAIADRMEQQAPALRGKLAINQRVWDDHVAKLRNNANERQAEALAKFTQAHRESWRDEPDNPWHHIGLAWELAQTGMYEEAIAEAAKTTNTNTYYYDSIILRAHVRRQMGDWDGAEQELNRALSVSRSRPEAYLNRARLRLDQDRLAEGIEDAQQARRLVKQNDKLEPQVSEVLRALQSRQAERIEAVGEGCDPVCVSAGADRNRVVDQC